MKEIECRFLEIDKDALIAKLRELGAKDEGEKMLEETMFYDKDLTWKKQNRFIRVRSNGVKHGVTYKEHQTHEVDGSFELELAIDDFKNAEVFFEKIGFSLARRQQKKRHTFKLGEVTIDIDTWPRIPTYVEIEGTSEDDLKKTAELLGLDWKDADFHNAGWIIMNKYNIPVIDLKYFTFDRFE